MERKKEKLQIVAGTERSLLRVETRNYGALELRVDHAGAPRAAGPLAGWSLEGRLLREIPVLPAGFVAGARVIPHAAIPTFLEQDWPALKTIYDVQSPPQFTFEIARPEIEVRLEGALSGLTLELHATYGALTFPIGWKAETSLGEYHTDPKDLHRFWRRDLSVEKSAAIEVQSAGFQPVRGGGLSFSLTQENNVARFLANTLPRWRREWRVTFGARLEATMREIDIAEPAFALRSGSGGDWLSLDLQLNVAGHPVPLDPAEVQRWLQTGQSHTRTANRRVLLVPTQAWGEMREVLADCEVAQEPGSMRVERTFAPYLAGALTEQGFRVARNDATSSAPPDVSSALDPKLWTQCGLPGGGRCVAGRAG